MKKKIKKNTKTNILRICVLIYPDSISRMSYGNAELQVSREDATVHKSRRRKKIKRRKYKKQIPPSLSCSAGLKSVLYKVGFIK